MSETNTTATSLGLASCHLCLKLVDNQRHHCPRCGASVHLRKADSIQRTLALLIAASILYIPANLLPMMITDQLGNSIESTIIGGVFLLIDMGSYAIAAVIFIASVMVPSGKLLVMYYLCWSVRHAPPNTVNQRTVLYRITEFIGKWSMIDVFVVAILVALIHIDNILVIRPGAATIAFASVVMISMVAAESFDPRMMWDQVEDSDE
ncbi:MAG: paraquat-inducible protein A [Porticoccus sp.]